MKRTNLVLDEHLLEEAKRLTGARTYSATVDKALQELVRRTRARQILDLQGTGLWDGDLAAMRNDSIHQASVIHDGSAAPRPPRKRKVRTP